MSTKSLSEPGWKAGITLKPSQAPSLNQCSISSATWVGVPIESAALKGMDSLLSIVQMPAGVPVGTLAIGRAGAVNAALLAAAILALADPALAARLEAFRAEQSAGIAEQPVDSAEGA